MRADKFFAERFGSRTKAKEVLLSGRVTVGGRRLSPHDEVTGEEHFTIFDGDDFVSGGGKKLERGLSLFWPDVSGTVFADLGASTGGFTDCLLRRGAQKVYCVDVGKSQLSPVLREDARVVVMDETNARYLTAASFPERIGGVVGDLSFISLRLILPAVASVLGGKGRAVLLFKPQFECEGRGLGKSGILPRKYHAGLLGAFYDFCLSLGFFPAGIVNAPVVAGKNVEYIVLLETEGGGISRERFLASAENIL